MSKRHKQVWTDQRLARLQRMLVDGKTPEQCAVEMGRKPSTIKTVISKHDLRYTPPVVEGSARAIAIARRPMERLPEFGGWDFFGENEEPGDLGGAYKSVSVAGTMPRREEAS